jgi:lipoprotein-anchoring transpeptidase ErfK/SrfK
VLGFSRQRVSAGAASRLPRRTSVSRPICSDGRRGSVLRTSLQRKQFAGSRAFIRPNASGISANERVAGDSVLRASVSLVVIALALAGSVGRAAAQYLTPQQPPVGYPPPASYAYPAGPPRYPGRYPNAVPGVPPSQDNGTVVAALLPEYQPERGADKELSPRFHRAVVDYATVEPPGTIIIDTPNTYLYLTLGHSKAIRYGIGVGREGFTWSGTEHISRMKEWPDWLPPKEMIKRQPYLPRFMAGGETNPLGARAMYLGNAEYRIHGTNQPSTIGTFVSSGCIRLTNEDVEDLYSRLTIGTTVVVLPGANTATSQLRPRH